MKIKRALRNGNGVRIISDFTENPREEKEDQLLSISKKVEVRIWKDFQAAPKKYYSLQIVHRGESTEEISSPGKDRPHGWWEVQGECGGVCEKRTRVVDLLLLLRGLTSKKLKLCLCLHWGRQARQKKRRLSRSGQQTRSQKFSGDDMRQVSPEVEWNCKILIVQGCPIEQAQPGTAPVDKN